MKHILLVGICSISVLSSCATKPITYSVNMVSNTLTINNTSVVKNKDYEGTISLIDQDEDYRLPTLITITISNKALSDDDYTYDFTSGKLKINADLIKDNITIAGERATLDGYKADFICDEHVKVSIYKTRDYDVDPKETNLAYARDENTGELLKDGKGEINFKVTIDENYDIDILWVRGLYDKCQDNEKTKKEDTYRITKIRSDLQVTITTKKIYCKKLTASDDLANHSFTFSWQTRKPENVDHISIDVSAVEYSSHYDIYSSTFTFAEAIQNKAYNFIFTPILIDGTIGDSVSITRFITQKENVSGLPRIEIATENNLMPEYKNHVANYVQNITKIYDTNETLVYDSSKGYSESKKYDGSKIKIRGNYSAEFFSKKPYKIKLKKDADLLESFRTNANASIDYTNKNWILLSPNTNIADIFEETSLIYHTPIGFAIADTLDFDWKPAYQFVNLYFNNDYQGMYILCESTAKGNGAGDAQSRYKIDDSGFIIEKDLYDEYEDLTIDTPINFDGKVKFTFKYPDTDDINAESLEYLYIREYLVELENNILDFNPKCFDLIDRDSLIKWLLAHDILATTDCFGSNIFLYKKNQMQSDKLKMGTIWDFGTTLQFPNTLSIIRYSENFYYKWLLNLDGFKDDVKLAYINIRSTIMDNVNKYLNKLNNELYNKILNIEAKRWNFEIVTMEKQKNDVLTFFSEHLAYLDDNL